MIVFFDFDSCEYWGVSEWVCMYVKGALWYDVYR